MSGPKIDFNVDPWWNTGSVVWTQGALPDLKVVDQTESKNAESYQQLKVEAFKILATHFCSSGISVRQWYELETCPSQSNRKHRYVVCDDVIRYKTLLFFRYVPSAMMQFRDENLRAWNSHRASKNIHKTSIGWLAHQRLHKSSVTKQHHIPNSYMGVS